MTKLVLSIAILAVVAGCGTPRSTRALAGAVTTVIGGSVLYAADRAAEPECVGFHCRQHDGPEPFGVLFVAAGVALLVHAALVPEER